MANIDERVVEMKFRREDFLKGTEETLSALGRLEEGLLGAGGIGETVSSLAGKFSTVGTVGIGALVALGGAAVNAGTKLMNNVIDPIFTGGKKRALNLEQADFQLMGILNSAEDVAAVMVNVSDAVDGTAYGLDAAAIAAAQFAASGMRAGDDMANALKGISGVAAMAGSSYEDVSSVFTKVAGQGRLMGDDLNRLASRGINAAATMVEYYHTTGEYADITEAKLRELVSKGKVSFEDFADAMSSAFGEHATKANETYTGSLSNIKAALGRIGAPAFTIEHEKMRRVFNALRPAINAFQKSLGPVYEMYNRLYAIPMANTFEKWGKKLESLDFTPLATTMSQFLVIGSSLRNVIISWTKPIADAFSIIFADAPTGSWMETVRHFLDGFNRDIGGLAATEEQAGRVRDAFVKVFEAVKGFADFVSAAFEFIKPIVKSLWDTFLEGIDYVVAAFNEYLRPYLEEAFEYLFGLESPIRQFWDTFRAEVENSGSVIETLGTYFRNFYDKYVSPAIKSLENFKDVLISIKDEGFTGLREKIQEAFSPLEGLWVWIGSLKDRMKDFFTGVANPLGGIKAEFPSVGESIKMLVTWIIDGFKEAEPVLGDMLTGVGEFFRNLGTLIGDFMANVTLEDAILIKEAIGQIVLGIMAFKALKSITGVFDGVRDGINGFFGAVNTAITDFNSRANQAAKGNTFLKIAGGLAIIAAALWILSKIPTDKLLISAGVLTVLGGVIVGFMFAIDKIDGATLAKAGFGLGLFSAALFGLAVTMVLLGMVPFDTLVQGMVALGLLMAAMVIAGAVLGTFATDMPATAFGLMLLAGALTLLIIPITTLGAMPYDVLLQGMTSLGLILAALVIAAGVLGQAAPNMIQAGVGLVAVAGALTLMVIPIRQLGEMQLGVLAQGLIATAIALGILVAAALIMQNLGAGAAGVVALSAALVILAFGIQTLANIPFGAAAAGLGILAVALVILVGASAVASAVLPGVLGLAGLMLAFGVAAVLVGVAAILFATGAVILGAALPGLAEGLRAFAEVSPTLAEATPYMLALGAGLIVFGVGALVAGAGALLLGAGLLTMAAGLGLLIAVAPAGAEALLAFIDAIEPLIWKLPQIALITAGLLALGAALLVLGAGMLLAGIGAVVLGVGALVAAVGLAALLALAGLTAALAPMIAAGFTTLGEATPALIAFGSAVLKVVVGLAAFSVVAGKVLSTITAVTSGLTAMTAGFMKAASASSRASTMISKAMTQMGLALQMGAALIRSGSTLIVSAFTALASGIMSTGPMAASAATAVISQIVQALSRGAVLITVAIALITAAFQNLGRTIPVAGAISVVATTVMMTGIQVAMTSGTTRTAAAIALLLAAFALIAPGIGQNGSKVSRAVVDVVTRIVTTLNGSRSRVSISGFAVGVAMGTGMISGLNSQRARIATQARNMATQALNAAKQELAIRSPSGKFREVGNFAVDGFLLPFRDRMSEAGNASADMGNSMLDAMDSALRDMESQFTDMDQWGMSPVITPVLDLDPARRQMRGLQGVGSIGGDLGRSQASSLALLDEALNKGVAEQREGSVQKVEYTQNNYSPKALSEAEIYRRTRNLISGIERRDY